CARSPAGAIATLYFCDHW
nr:immunoglobulin heavy chain junction region [Macaca mulatta]